MKRRAADSGKLRRPVKRTKITEGMYGNWMVYVKIVMLWAGVMTADYVLEFRLELLWPLWMMLRSVIDSFKYQGLAFSVLFICIALTSDVACFFFIPVQWVFFAASAYVWVQYVWYTVSCLEKGICLPSVVLCCALVYVEGAMRGVRERGGGGGLDLCRPFAAHCVGYPVVTLGFGVKSYVGHRMRLRRQREVRTANEFYYQLLRQALPEPVSEQPTKEEATAKSTVANGSVDKSAEEKQMNGHAHPAKSKKEARRAENGTCLHEDRTCKDKPPAASSGSKDKEVKSQHSMSNGVACGSGGGGGGSSGGGGGDEKTEEPQESHTPPDKAKGNQKSSSCKEKKEKELSTQKEEKKKSKNKDKEKEKEMIENHKPCEQIKETTKESTKDKETTNLKEITNKDKEREKDKEKDKEQRESVLVVEELKRTRASLATSRAAEAELRKALAGAQAAERARRQDHAQLKLAHRELQIKVNSLTDWRTTERATFEKRLEEERQRRNSAERQLQRRHQTNKASDCGGEWCRSRRAASDAEATSLRRELQRYREQAAQLQRDLGDANTQVSSLEAQCRTASAQPSDAGVQQLAAAHSLLKERAAHLERSLSAETRIKLDLFSALGEAKRQLQIREGIISSQEKEIDGLKAKIAQILAVMPSDNFAPPPPGAVSKLRLPSRQSPESQANSSLDPNATVYTPKNLPCSDA